ncbi:hypothetical protein ACGIJE_01340 [Corynebacterium hesseae]
MRLSEKKMYAAALAAAMVLYLVAAILAFVGVSNIALGFLSLATLFLPVVSHLRMRRSLAATRKMVSNPQSLSPDVAGDRLLRIEDSIRALERGMADLKEAQRRQGAVSEITKQAQAVRREARLARLLNEETLKNLK